LHYFDKIQACDSQTDKQTQRHVDNRQYSACLAIYGPKFTKLSVHACEGVITVCNVISQ